MKIKESTYLRLRTLAAHPKANMRIEDMLAMCVEEGMDFDSYAVSLTLQLAIIDAMEAFSKEKRAYGVSQSQVLNSAAAASAVAVAWLTSQQPLPGSDVAGMVANDVVQAFAKFLARGITWVQPPEIKRPTVDGNTTRN